MNQEIICGSVITMKCTILWNTLPLDQWQKRFASVAQSNILQSYSYAQACAKTYGQKARWGLIMMEDQEAGLVQIIESRLFFGGIHALILDRGPLWFDGFGGAAHIKLFFDEINQQFPKRFGRKRRILPEIDTKIGGGGAVEQIIRQCGFEKKDNIYGYQTIWWDMTLDDATARAQLKSNWRGSLKKAENAGLEIEWDFDQKLMNEFKMHYIQDKLSKGYTGISPKLLNNLALFSAQQKSMIIGRAKLGGESIAGILLLMHGQCATYQIGWSMDKGRQNAAHHLLLWQARDVLKDYNVQKLDLGGINDHDENQKGLSSFKRGIGGREVELAGHYF